MVDWKSLRIWATVLLCLPLLHAGYLLSREFAAYIDPSPMVWSGDLQAIISRDQFSSLPKAPVLIVGGQRVGLWDSLEGALQPRAVLARSLGDATLEDLTYHYDRLIAFYRPETLVVVPSYGDLHLRAPKTAAEFAAALEALLTVDDSFGTTQNRYVFVPVKTLLHPEDGARIDSIAAALQALARRSRDLQVLDPNPLLASDDGTPSPLFFRGDGVNLNDSGYARLTVLLRTRLERDGVISIKG